MSPDPQAIAKFRDETHATTNFYNPRRSGVVYIRLEISKPPMSEA
jgi:hypothetical protein